MSFYPGAAEFNSGTLTVDAALTDPTHIEQRIADLVQPNLLADHMFTTGGEVTGGAVIYSRTTEKHLFTENDVADRNPGDEYPVVYAERPESEIARVQDFGGKFAVTDEARRRNDAITFDNDVTRLSNTIKRKLDRRVIETLDAADATGETNQLAVPKKWSEVEVHGDPANRSAGVDLPASVLATAIGLGEEKRPWHQLQPPTCHPNDSRTSSRTLWLGLEGHAGRLRARNVRKRTRTRRQGLPRRQGKRWFPPLRRNSDC